MTRHAITNLSLLAVVTALVAATSGCAAYTSTLADIRTAQLDYAAGLASVCPKERTSDLCTAGREWFVATDNLYQGAVLADQTGRDLEPLAKEFWTSLQNGWSSILALFGKKSPGTEEMAVVVSPSPVEADVTIKSWEETVAQPGASQ